MMERMYDNQLKRCADLNLLRKKYYTSFRFFKALSIERTLKREIQKLKIIEEIRKELEKHTRSITERQSAFLRRVNQAYDKKIS